MKTIDIKTYIKENKKKVIAISLCAICCIIAIGLVFAYCSYQKKYAYRKNTGYYSVTITPTRILKDIAPGDVAFIVDDEENLFAVRYPWEMDIVPNPEPSEGNEYAYKNKYGELAHSVGISTYMAYVEKICGTGSKITMTVFNGQEPLQYHLTDDPIENRYYVLDYPVYVNSVDEVSYTLNGIPKTEKFEDYKANNPY